jgi:type II secretory pathway pseudopilin PulG
MKATGHWQYSTTKRLEFIIVIIILSFLASLAVDIQTRSIIASKLTEPVSLISNARYHAMEYSAYTGKWPEEEFIHHSMKSTFSLVDSFKFMPSGSFEITFSKEDSTLYNKTLAFNLGTLNTKKGYVFYSWHCGNNHNVKPYKMVNHLKSTVPTIYSKTICREYL